MKRIRTSSASRVSAAEITPHGVVWSAIIHPVECAKLNLPFLKKPLTSVSPDYFRHANAVPNDLAARSIAVPMPIWNRGFAESAESKTIVMKYDTAHLIYTYICMCLYACRCSLHPNQIT